MREAHTADYLAKEMKEVMCEFGIDTGKVVSVCSDGASNIQAAIRQAFGQGRNVGRNVYCLAHLLNHVVSDGLNDTKNAKLTNLIKEVKALVTFARQSLSLMEKLREKNELAGTAEGNVILLVQAVATRWNSTYATLKRFVDVSSFVAAVVAEPTIKNSPRMISGEDIELMSEIIEI